MLDRRTTVFRPQLTRPPLSLLIGLVLLASPALAQQENVPPERPGDTPPPAEQQREPKCVHGCLRWGEFCNVDPRGVYKCHRRCEKFGEICE